jgi:RecG-like helicase
MIAEVWEGTLDCGPLSKTDEPLMAALSRHKKLRNAFENRIECGNSRVATLDGTKVDNLNGAVSSSTPQAIQGVIVTPVEPSEDKQDTDEEKARPKSLSNEEISNRIESSTGRIKERKVRRNRSKSSNESLSLGIAQCKASDFVEFVWSGDDSVGSVLDGPVASGKTVLSCSLMWRHHLEGAQLLVCSPTRLVSTLCQCCVTRLVS